MYIFKRPPENDVPPWSLYLPSVAGSGFVLIVRRLDLNVGFGIIVLVGLLLAILGFVIGKIMENLGITF